MSPTSEALAVTSQVPLLTPRESEEFLDKCGGVAEYDGQSQCPDAQDRTELESRQRVTKLIPGPSKSRLHMLSTNGTVTHDPAKCYLWTREELGFGWWYSSQFPPPQW
ncbi:MAG: hypothetical protein JNJ77_07590 [Planctomycetia bacterium]|nr:hypothetical protein [Planctomycetia bacterium]